MAFTLEQIVPWGRSLGEYQRMFSLSPVDYAGPILGCADGPASFNAEVTELGGRVVSCDPIFAYSAEQIRRRVSETSADVIAQARENADDFVWSHEIPDADALGRYRAETMNRFLADFERGRKQGRYLDTELPALSLPPQRFPLAVCSHFLFLYSDHLTEQFHVDSIRRLLEVADEVRVFPVLNLQAEISPYLTPVLRFAQSNGCDAGLEKVAYTSKKAATKC